MCVFFFGEIRLPPSDVLNGKHQVVGYFVLPAAAECWVGRFFSKNWPPLEGKMMEERGMHYLPEVQQFAPEKLPSQKERIVFQPSFSGK